MYLVEEIIFGELPNFTTVNDDSANEVRQYYHEGGNSFGDRTTVQPDHHLPAKPREFPNERVREARKQVGGLRC